MRWNILAISLIFTLTLELRAEEVPSLRSLDSLLQSCAQRPQDTFALLERLQQDQPHLARALQVYCQALHYIRRQHYHSGLTILRDNEAFFFGEVIPQAPEPINKWLASEYHYLRGAVYFYIDEYDSAYMDMLKYLELIKDFADPGRIVRAYASLAAIATLLEMPTEALNYYSQALKLVRIPERKALILGNLGVLHKRLKNYAIAQQFLEESLHQYQSLLQQDSTDILLQRGLIRNMINLADLYITIVEKDSLPAAQEFLRKYAYEPDELLDSALVLLKTSRALSRQYQLLRLEAHAAHDLAQLYYVRFLKSGQKAFLDSALDAALFADSIFQKIGEKKSLIDIRILLARLLRYRSPRQAYEYCVQAYQQLKEEHQHLTSVLRSQRSIVAYQVRQQFTKELLGELPTRCAYQRAVALGLSILAGVIMVLGTFLYTRRFT